MRSQPQTHIEDKEQISALVSLEISTVPIVWTALIGIVLVITSSVVLLRGEQPNYAQSSSEITTPRMPVEFLAIDSSAESGSMDQNLIHHTDSTKPQPLIMTAAPGTPAIANFHGSPVDQSNTAMNTANHRPKKFGLGPPRGNLMINGKVLNERGEPVVGIEVSATIQRQVSSEFMHFAVYQREKQNTITGVDGHFFLPGLSQGIYTVSTVPTDSFQSAVAVSPAGVSTLTLVVKDRRSVTVFGIISDPAGNPLAGVSVRTLNNTSSVVYSDNSGFYEIDAITANGQSSSILKFTLPLYRKYEMRFNLARLGADVPRTQSCPGTIAANGTNKRYCAY